MAYWVIKTDGAEHLHGGYHSEMRKVGGPFKDAPQAELAAQPHREVEARSLNKPVSAWRTFRYVYSVMSDEDLSTAQSLGTRVI